MDLPPDIVPGLARVGIFHDRDRVYAVGGAGLDGFGLPGPGRESPFVIFDQGLFHMLSVIVS